MAAHLKKPAKAPRPPKVFLLRPPYAVFAKGFEKRIGLPLGLCSIAAVLEQNGVRPTLFDAAAYDDSRDPLLWGASWDRIERAVREAGPDIVGITNQFSQQKSLALEAARRIKALDPGIRVIIGGPTASARPGDFLGSGLFDLAVVGEGEETILDILRFTQGRAALNEIPGLAWTDRGKLRINPPKRIENLDALPFPAYHLLDLERYFDLSRRGLGTRPADPFERPLRDMSLITSRGCPYNCVFCSIHASMGKRWRANSPEYVLRHVEHLVKAFRVELVHFEDDNFTFNRRRVQAILKGLAPLNVEWDTPNGIRADTLDRETLVLMKQSRVKEIRVALESGSQRVLDEVIGKRLDLARAVRVCRECHELGLPVSSFYVIGLPGETRREIDLTLDLAFRLMSAYGVSPHVSIANPLEGTPLFDACDEGGCLVPAGEPGAFVNGRRAIHTGEFSAGDIERAYASFHRKAAILYGLQFVKKPGRALQKLRTLIRFPRKTLELIRAILQTLA